MNRGLWHCIEGRDQDHPKGKEMQKDKMMLEEVLQIAMNRREAKEQRKDIPIWMQSSEE